MKNRFFSLIYIIVFLNAQDPGGDTAKQIDVAAKEPSGPPKKKSMEEALKNKKEIGGLFTMYQDTTNGKLFMLIKKEQLNKGEDGQTGAINTSEGGAFNPVYNAYDTPITPEETKTGRKIAGRDQVKKGVPVYNVNSWGIKYVTKEEKEEQSTKEDSDN